MKTKTIIVIICLAIVWGIFIVVNHQDRISSQVASSKADDWFNSLPLEAQQDLNQSLVLINKKEDNRAEKIKLLNCAFHIQTIAQSKMPGDNLESQIIAYLGEKTNHTLGAGGLGTLVISNRLDDASVCADVAVPSNYKTVTIPNAGMNYYE